MRIIVLVLSIATQLIAVPRWETRHYETTDNGFIAAAAIDSLTGLLCGVRDNVGVILYKTINGGDNWQETKPLTIQQAMFCFALHFPNQSTGYMTAIGLVSSIFPCAALYKTTDGGNTWSLNYGLTMSFMNMLWDDVFFVDLNNGWLAGSKSDIRRTTNAGASWTIQTAPVSTSLKSIHFINANEGWIVGGDYDTLTGQGINGAILHTSNGGANWTAQLSNARLQLWGVHFIDNARGWVCGYKDRSSPGVLLRTTDGGANWVEIMAPAVAMGSYGLYAIDFPEPLTGFTVGGGNRSGWSGSYFGAFLKTTDGGNNWIIDTVIFENDPWGLSPIDMDMYSARWGYAGGTRLSAFRYAPHNVAAEENDRIAGHDITIPTIHRLNDGICFNLKNPDEYERITVYDALGRKIFEMSSVSSRLIINAPSRGSYFVRFSRKQGAVYTRKVIVE